MAVGLMATVNLSACSIFGGSNEPERNEDGEIVEQKDDADVNAIQVGDCVGPFPDGEIAEIPVIPCNDPHEMEVFASVELDGDEYPGADRLGKKSENRCVKEFKTFVGVPYNESELFLSYLGPTDETWAQGDREVLCVVYEEADDSISKVTGSLEDAQR